MPPNERKEDGLHELNPLLVRVHVIHKSFDVIACQALPSHNYKLDRFVRREYGLTVKRGRRQKALPACCRHIMRILFCTILLATVFPRWSHAEELISGVLAFDPPSFLSGIPSGRDSTNSENGIRIVRRYAAADNDPRTSQRLVIVSLREIRVVPDSVKIATDGRLDNQALGAAMQAAVNSIRNATNITSLTNAEVGGQAAWRISYQTPRPYWQKPDGELFPHEVYWVKVETNLVVEIKLIADSPEHLQTLESCLPRFKIKNQVPCQILHPRLKPRASLALSSWNRLLRSNAFLVRVNVVPQKS